MLQSLVTYSYIAIGGMIAYQAFSFLGRYRASPSTTVLWCTVFAFASAVFAFMTATFYTVPGHAFVVLVEWHFLLSFVIFIAYLRCMKGYFAFHSGVLTWLIRVVGVLSVVFLAYILLGYALGESLIFPKRANPADWPGLLLPKQLAQDYDFSHGGRAIYGLIHIAMIVALLCMLIVGRTGRDRIIQTGLIVSFVLFLHNTYTSLADTTFYVQLLPFMNLIELTRFEWIARRSERLALAQYKARFDSFDQSIKQHTKLKKLGEEAASFIHDAINIAFANDSQLKEMERSVAEDDGVALAGQIKKARHKNEQLLALLAAGRDDYLRNRSDEELDLPLIIEDATELARQRLDEVGVDLTVRNQVSRHTYGDVARLTQVFVNMIHNACDAMHGQPGRWIEIELKDFGRFTIISIINSGPKIPPALHEQIFEPFFTTKSDAGGYGLGLKICRDNLLAMGGEVVLNTESPYTRFDLLLHASDTPVAS